MAGMIPEGMAPAGSSPDADVGAIPGPRHGSFRCKRTHGLEPGSSTKRIRSGSPSPHEGASQSSERAESQDRAVMHDIYDYESSQLCPKGWLDEVRCVSRASGTKSLLLSPPACASDNAKDDSPRRTSAEPYESKARDKRAKLGRPSSLSGAAEVGDGCETTSDDADPKWPREPCTLGPPSVAEEAVTHDHIETSPPPERRPLPDIDLDCLLHAFNTTWFLNQTVAFPDPAEEKFFFTYFAGETWHRVSVEWNYNDLQAGSLEAELRNMRLQQDKSLRLYKLLHHVLPDISFYEGTTLLELETRSDGQLHISTSDDQAQPMCLPPISQLVYIDIPHYQPADISVLSHLSGFVYKVRCRSSTVVLKTMPDSNVKDAFMYEINALWALRSAPNIIRLKGIVSCNLGIQGILLSYASRGTLADNIRTHPSWNPRRTWAGQLIAAVNGVHDAGFVQGDLTLENVLVDATGTVRLCDFNRRGVPVGWEPPELKPLIEARQSVGMLVGVKTDIWQLGMCLWGLAKGEPEPDRHRFADPVEMVDALLVEAWFVAIVRGALARDPRKRRRASELRKMFVLGQKGEGQGWRSPDLVPCPSSATGPSFVDEEYEVDPILLETDGKNHGVSTAAPPATSCSDDTCATQADDFNAQDISFTDDFSRFLI